MSSKFWYSKDKCYKDSVCFGECFINFIYIFNKNIRSNELVKGGIRKKNVWGTEEGAKWVSEGQKSQNKPKVTRFWNLLLWSGGGETEPLTGGIPPCPFSYRHRNTWRLVHLYHLPLVWKLSSWNPPIPRSIQNWNILRAIYQTLNTTRIF